MAPGLHRQGPLDRAGHTRFHPKLTLIQRAGEGRLRACSSNPSAPIRRPHCATEGFFKPRHLDIW